MQASERVSEARETPEHPTISVIIPVYNQAQFLGHAMDSVLAQTWKDFELIVVDDGSTDGSGEVAQQYGSRVRCVRKANGGGASAVNAGVRVAKGSWIAILPSDDLWEPSKLQRQWGYIAGHPEAAFVYSDYSIVDVNGKKQRDTSHPVPSGRSRQRLHLLRGCFINGGSVLLRKSLFEEIGGFDEGNRYAPDYDYWLRVTERYPAVRIPEPLLRYRVHGGQDSMRFRAIWTATYQVVRKFLRREPARVILTVMVLRLYDQAKDLLIRLSSARSPREVAQHLGTVLETLKVLVNPYVARKATG